MKSNKSKDMKNKKIAIYIPAYNVAHVLPRTLDRISPEIKAKVSEIFVVDNASEDNTYLTVIGYRHDRNEQKIKIIRSKKNRGYGGSQKLAYNYCLEKDYDIVVMLHGDAQYAPEYLSSLIEPIEKGEADLVFGSRMRGNPLKGGMPLWKYVGNKALTKIENLVLGTNLSEFHSGYRVFNCKALKKIPFNFCSDEYYFDTQILVQFHLAGLRIAERPIPTHYGKESGHPSLKSLYLYCSNIILTMGKYLLHNYNIKKYKVFDIEIKKL
jgi:glycosyltransferase involved in cell wall biosynthesis